MPKSYYRISEKKKLFNKKIGNVTFFYQNWFVNLSEYIWFFSNFWKPHFSKDVWVVFVNCFGWVSRIFLSIVRSLFAKKYPNSVTFDHFFETKKEFRRLEKGWKIRKYSNKLINQFWPKKLDYWFFGWRIFLINMSNQCSYHLPNGWVFFIFFHFIRKYSKSSPNLTFHWECNDTPLLNNLCDYILYVHKLLNLVTRRNL